VLIASFQTSSAHHLTQEDIDLIKYFHDKYHGFGSVGCELGKTIHRCRRENVDLDDVIHLPLATLRPLDLDLRLMPLLLHGLNALRTQGASRN
jgi:hypothetical protein